MLTKCALRVVVVCCLVVSVSQILYSQANGSFSGTVADKTGSVITGAKVTITSQDTGLVREATTDASGHYVVPFLPVSVFTIRAEAQGFKTAQEKDLKLQVNEQRELDFTLAPASVTENVEVSATEVAVETTNASLGQVITEQQVADLPLNGRNFVQLATLTPGTTQDTNPGSFFTSASSSEVAARGAYSLSVGGSRSQSTDWLYDGVDNNELTAGGLGVVPSIDAIQEFKVLTYSYSAEYGTRAGPTVLISSKSGSNNFHGTLFEFFRNTSLDARNPFVLTGKDKFNLNQFGGSIGGPIQKDKTFFFADYQGTRRRRGLTFTGLIPTPAMKGGDFTLDPFGNLRGGPNSTFANLVNPYSGQPFACNAGVPVAPNPDGSQTGGTPCNKIPVATIANGGMADPAGLAMINLYPQSNTSNAGLGFNYVNVPVRKLNESQADIRVDHNFSSKDSIFARFSYDQANSFVPGGSPGFANQNAFGSNQNISNHGRNVAISETHIFSDRNINQITAGYNRIFNHILSIGDRSCLAADIGILGANLNSRCPNAPAGVTNQSTKDCISCGLSSTLMGQYWALGDRGFAPFQGGTNVFSVSDSFDMIRGKHEIRVGMSIRANQMNVETNAFQDGFFINFGISGDPTSALLLGQMGGYIHDQTFDGATTGRRWKMFRPYVQDNWRVTPDLTLNIGLAWALVTPITEAQNRQANFDFLTGKWLVAGSSSGLNGCGICVRTDGRVGVELDKTALEPRIGIAWKPFGSQKTAVRLGYSMFHDSSWNQGGQGLWENPPYLAETDNFNGFCPFQSLGTTGCGLRGGFLPVFTQPVNPQNFTGTYQSQNLNFKQGRVQQFNFDIERQLPGNVVFTTGYAGSRSHHILVDGLNLNVGSPAACGVVPGYTLGCGPGGTAFAPPYSPFTVIANINDVGDARYDSLQVKAETKSARHGLYALIGYTYSRTFDSGFADGLGTFPGATYWPLPGTRHADWALSTLNANHQFTASVLYDLPFGKGKRWGNDWGAAANGVFGNWEVDVIERANSGFPLFIVSGNGSGVNFQWNGSSLNRPNQVGDPTKAGIVPGNPDPACQVLVSQGGRAPDRVGTTSAWFNQCAFADAPPGELGNSNRAPVYGPRYVNTDLSLIKHIPIHESVKLDFRAELFNLFNHPQFLLPGDPGVSNMQNVDAPTSFGKITNIVKDPRVAQFALKLNF